MVLLLLWAVGVSVVYGVLFGQGRYVAARDFACADPDLRRLEPTAESRFLEALARAGRRNSGTPTSCTPEVASELAHRYKGLPRGVRPLFFKDGAHLGECDDGLRESVMAEIRAVRSRCNLDLSGTVSVRAWEPPQGHREPNWMDVVIATALAWGPLIGFVTISVTLTKWIRWLLRPPAATN